MAILMGLVKTPMAGIDPASIYGREPLSTTKMEPNLQLLQWLVKVQYLQRNPSMSPLGEEELFVSKGITQKISST